MTITEAKTIINIANDLYICKYDLFEKINNKETDFEIDNYSFMTKEEALKNVLSMYSGDEYLLGSFYASFISDFINLDYEDILSIQETDQNQILGKMILNSGSINEMMEEYIRLDGYGHALNSYDGNWDELTINNTDYIFFRNY